VTATCAALRAGLPAAWPLRCVDEAALEPKLATYDDRRFDDYGGDGAYRDRRRPGPHEGATFPTWKAPSSVGFHSFRLIFGRAIIFRSVGAFYNGNRARGALALKR
jgi:hypothetical protein